GMQTGWVRVMTPDGGSSSDVKSNRGFVFIPEVGDQVLLGFRHGDPARPYVMGSLFNGTTGGGGGQGNNCKSLTTRSGSSLKLDDSAGSVTLHDKGGVSMNFDGAGNATTNAKSSNFVNAGTNNVINVGNGSSVISSDSDGNITLKGNTAITLVVGDNQVKVCTEGIFINGKQQVVIGTDETMSLQAKQDMTMSSKTNLNMSGKTTATLGSKDISITGGSKVVVDGPDVNINS
ncbi:phage baseplate assembly protein V, partial [Prevotella melaninogenica]